MRRLYLSGMLILLGACQQTAKPQANKKLTQIIWRDTIIDLGTVQAGKAIPLTFYLKNTGDQPLLLEKVESTCGCTVIQNDNRHPIVPGATDSIMAQFKMAVARGIVLRKIYVLANTKQAFYVLNIKANVIE